MLLMFLLAPDLAMTRVNSEDCLHPMSKLLVWLQVVPLSAMTAAGAFSKVFRAWNSQQRTPDAWTQLSCTNPEVLMI